MKLLHLRTFLSVAREGGIRAAARKNSVSQSAITRIVRELELDLDVPLVRRSASGVELTSFGHALAVRANLILEETDRARDELRQMKTGEATKVRLATSSLPALLCLAPAIATFRKRHEDVAIECHEALVTTALPALREGRLDFVLTQDASAPTATDLASEQLLRAQLVIGARANHPRAQARNLAELVDEEWVGWSREMVEVPFIQHGIRPPSRVLIAQSSVLARKLVESASVLGIFARPVIEAQNDKNLVHIIDVKESLPPMFVSLVTRKGVPLTPAATALTTEIRKAIRSIRN